MTDDPFERVVATGSATSRFRVKLRPINAPTLAVPQRSGWMATWTSSLLAVHIFAGPCAVFRTWTIIHFCVYAIAVASILSPSWSRFVRTLKQPT